MAAIGGILAFFGVAASLIFVACLILLIASFFLQKHERPFSLKELMTWGSIAFAVAFGTFLASAAVSGDSDGLNVVKIIVAIIFLPLGAFGYAMTQPGEWDEEGIAPWWIRPLGFVVIGISGLGFFTLFD